MNPSPEPLNLNAIGRLRSRLGTPAGSEGAGAARIRGLVEVLGSVLEHDGAAACAALRTPTGEPCAYDFAAVTRALEAAPGLKRAITARVGAALEPFDGEATWFMLCKSMARSPGLAKDEAKEILDTILADQAVERSQMMGESFSGARPAAKLETLAMTAWRRTDPKAVASLPPIERAVIEGALTGVLEEVTESLRGAARARQLPRSVRMLELKVPALLIDEEIETLDAAIDLLGYTRGFSWDVPTPLRPADLQTAAQWSALLWRRDVDTLIPRIVFAEAQLARVALAEGAAQPSILRIDLEPIRASLPHEALAMLLGWLGLPAPIATAVLALLRARTAAPFGLPATPLGVVIAELLITLVAGAAIASAEATARIDLASATIFARTLPALAAVRAFHDELVAGSASSPLQVWRPGAESAPPLSYGVLWFSAKGEWCIDRDALLRFEAAAYTELAGATGLIDLRRSLQCRGVALLEQLAMGWGAGLDAPTIEAAWSGCMRALLEGGRQDAHDHAELRGLSADDRGRLVELWFPERFATLRLDGASRAVKPQPKPADEVALAKHYTETLAALNEHTAAPPAWAREQLPELPPLLRVVGGFTLTEVLAASPPVVEALASSSSLAWIPLLEAIMANKVPPAPAAFVNALLGRDAQMEVWERRVFDAVSWAVPERWRMALTPRKRFAQWFHEGVPRALAADDPRRLAARLEELERHPEWDVIEHGRALLVAIRSSDADPELLHRALLVHAARCLEEGLWDEAEEAATAARPFERDENLPRRALRLRAAALFGRNQIEAGLGALDEMFLIDATTGSTAGPVLHAKRFFDGLSDRETVLRSLALAIQAAGKPDALSEPLTELVAVLAGAATGKKDAAAIRRWLAGPERQKS